MGKTMKNAVFTLLFLTICVFAVLLAYFHFFADDDKNLSGEWTTELYMTEQAAAVAFSWLQDIEAVSVSLEDMESYMQDLNIQVNLAMEQTARFKGTFRCNVQPESYEACNKAAYEAFAKAFRELLAERLRMAGYTGDTGEEALEALVNETFGMSTVSYLMSCGPALLPSLEELQAQYDGSGTYENADGVLTRQFDAGGYADGKSENYVRSGSVLVLSGETDSAAQDSDSGRYPVVYTLK